MASSSLKMRPAVGPRQFARANCSMRNDVVSEHLQAPHRSTRVASASVTSSTLRELSDLPEEPGLPYLGVALKTIDPTNDWDDVFEKHGSDAVWLNMGPGGGWMLALRSVDDVIECSVAKSQAMFTKWPPQIEDMVMPLGRSATNEEQQPLRAALGQLLSKGAVLRLHLPLMVPQFTSTLRQHAASGEEVRWWGTSKRLTFAAAARAALGDVLSEQDMDELFPLSVEAGMGIYRLNFGLKEGVPFTGYWRAVRAQKQLLALLRARITAVLQDRRQLEGRGSVLREVLPALEADGGAEAGLPSGGPSQRGLAARLAREVMFLMFAGTDTTAVTMCRAMQCLSRHPQWLQALADEQRHLIAEYGEDIDRKVVSRSTVALAVAQEALRLKPIASMLFRQTTDDVTVGGLAVPAGTSIALCPVKMTQRVGTGSANFDPQQWLSGDRTECAAIAGERGFFAFGKGPRNCVGQNLAMIELVTYLAILAREVQGIEMSREEMEMDFQGAHPTGMPLKLIPRSPQ